MPSLHQPAGQSPLGLTASQVRARIQAGQVNTPPESPTKSVKRIVLENLFSFFNLIFFIIAGFLIAVGSFGELIFLLVVAANTAIGIIQELHAKKKLDALSLLSAPRAQVIRDSKVSSPAGAFSPFSSDARGVRISVPSPATWGARRVRSPICPRSNARKRGASAGKTRFRWTNS